MSRQNVSNIFYQAATAQPSTDVAAAECVGMGPALHLFEQGFRADRPRQIIVHAGIETAFAIQAERKLRSVRLRM
jgi:hypothetical protein